MSMNSHGCCGRYFKTADALEQHRRNGKHAASRSLNVSLSGPGSCCGRTFRASEALQQHRHDLYHRDSRPLTIPAIQQTPGSCCGRSFKTAAALEQHQRHVKHELNPSANTSALLANHEICCGRLFKTMAALLQHQQDAQHDTKVLSSGKVDSCTSIKSSPSAPEMRALYCCGQRFKDEEARRQHCQVKAHGYSCKSSESCKVPSMTQPIWVEKGACKPRFDRLQPRKLSTFTFPRRTLHGTGQTGMTKSSSAKENGAAAFATAVSLVLAAGPETRFPQGLANVPTTPDMARSLAAMSLSAAFGRQPEPSTCRIVDYDTDDEDGGVRLSEGIVSAGPEILPL